MKHPRADMLPDATDCDELISKYGTLQIVKEATDETSATTMEDLFENMDPRLLLDRDGW